MAAASRRLLICCSFLLPFAHLQLRLVAPCLDRHCRLPRLDCIRHRFPTRNLRPAPLNPLHALRALLDIHQPPLRHSPPSLRCKILCREVASHILPLCRLRLLLLVAGDFPTRTFRARLGTRGWWMARITIDRRTCALRVLGARVDGAWISGTGSLDRWVLYIGIRLAGYWDRCGCQDET